MAKEFLIDSNIVIDFIADRLSFESHQFIADCIDQHPAISIVTKIELLGFSKVTPETEELVRTALVIGLTDEISDQTIILRRNYKIKLPDAIIAAAAMFFDRILITRNYSDFKIIKGLRLVHPLKYK
ncbi:MAG: type II toxin-antitoxin system VapC family toxin [Bacteroidetes bacterium]|nr:type II toxin-antitoxin system VapC family toxin [Bacteroidota bacterium]MBS1539797.1 type II toxin-antitoxin system VapC family toxin [Bacteroidota bacterium]